MKKTLSFKLLDIFYITMMVLPLLGCWVLKTLYTPVSDGITVEGPRVYWTIIQTGSDVTSFFISESIVVSTSVVITLAFFCLFLTHGISVIPNLKRQILAEYIVEAATKFVTSNMGNMFIAFAPFLAGMMGLSAFSSLASLVGLFSPTSDINIVAGWAILVFILITHYKMKGGVINYLKSFGDPIPIFYPFNVISEIATPVSMTFRHYGNILSGAVISTLVASVLASASNAILSLFTKIQWITEIPFLRVGIPAVLSLYFDLFSSLLQAFIFAILTALYIANGYPEEQALERKLKKEQKKKIKN